VSKINDKMNHVLKQYLLLTILGISLLSCTRELPDPVSTAQLRMDFSSDAAGDMGWLADYSDYAIPQENLMEFESGRAMLPPPLPNDQFGFKLSGHNRSDDMFMFMYYSLTGLLPNREYTVTFDLEIASKYAANSVGIGGSPGSSVYLKVGAVGKEPKKELLGDYYAMNIEKGQQSQGGPDMQVIGNIAIGDDKQEYELINRNNSNEPFKGRTDSNGNLWLIIGTDSGFEGLTTIYFNKININVEL